ncbi:uncharacterized protein ALTATR162_LOCUS12050 [Alternaria atra]|uniref:Uncharacterized protein n=1 Tax=Alternaria atra TaxID=119953 RepID=A0A8J2N645_9PLEO|nr:uncharacterized protein ALTATR162_LOCUS12050 [Alternaria atra]CAG5188875.1 unnamed protein product [Alternaria atra]
MNPPRPRQQCDNFNMPDRVTTKSDSAILPTTGKQIRQHEAAGLKGLSKEQIPKFWEEVEYWNKEFFSEAKWQEVLKRIWRARQEHGMMVLGWHPPPKPIHSILTPGGRHLLLYSSSSLTAPTGAHPLRPAHLPRIETASPSIPRPRWDVVSAGPATPLSTTTGPVKNAFAEGGFWASLSPKASSLAGIPTPTTPTAAAMPYDLYTFHTPTDLAAKTTYEEVRGDVNKMALQLCASRHALRRSFTTENDVIHPSMVRPRDTLLAAELTLSSYKLPESLSSYIDPLFPAKIENYADEEAVGAKQYSIPSLSQLEDVDAWLQYDEKTGEMTTILEAQRDLLRMNRERRKGREVVVREGGVRLAWAVRVVNDAQLVLERHVDAGGEDSDDEGYEYGNFIRSLGGGEQKGSLRSSGSTLDLSLLKSSSTRSSNESDIVVTHRSASGPIKPTYDSSFGHNTLPLRNRTLTLSSLSTAVPSSGSHTHHDSYLDSYERRQPSTIHSIRRSNATVTATATAISTTSNLARTRRNFNSSFSINTTGIDTFRESLLSPQERGTRRRGPSIQDLSSWADELKKMERKRAEVRLAGGGSRRRDPSVSQKVVDEEGGGRQGDGLVINGCVHPALRGGGQGESENEDQNKVKRLRSRGGTGSSTASWRCSTAAGIEGDMHSGTVDYATDNEAEHYQGGAEDGDITTLTPECMDWARQPRRSSSSPTHPAIRLSSLTALRLSPPRRPPRPLPAPLPECSSVPPTPILLPAPSYNRYASTSYERQASRPVFPLVTLSSPSVSSTLQRGAKKAVLLEEAVRSNQHLHALSMSKMNEKEKEEEWGEELRAMEGRERLRQLGLDRGTETERERGSGRDVG